MQTTSTAPATEGWGWFRLQHHEHEALLGLRGREASAEVLWAPTTICDAAHGFFVYGSEVEALRHLPPIGVGHFVLVRINLLGDVQEAIEAGVAGWQATQIRVLEIVLDGRCSRCKQPVAANTVPSRIMRRRYRRINRAKRMFANLWRQRPTTAGRLARSGYGCLPLAGTRSVVTVCERCARTPLTTSDAVMHRISWLHRYARQRDGRRQTATAQDIAKRLQLPVTVEDLEQRQQRVIPRAVQIADLEASQRSLVITLGRLAEQRSQHRSRIAALENTNRAHQARIQELETATANWGPAP